MQAVTQLKDILVSEKQYGFWSTIPGILTGLATLVTAITGLYIAIFSGGQNTTELAQNGHTRNNTPVVQSNIIEPVSKAEPATNTSAITLPSLVDCKMFPTVNTVESLMGWSNHYHKQIINSGASNEACNKTIAYRAQAHCKSQQDLAIRQGLSETLSLCTQAGFDWKEIKL